MLHSWEQALWQRLETPMNTSLYTDYRQIIFADPLGKNFVSKGDYTEKGPRAVLEMSSSLL